MRVHRSIVIAVSLLVLGFGSAASAKDTKIGIVDLDMAVGATTEGKTAREELEKKKREAELEIQPMIERYQQLTDEYQKKRVVLSPEKLREMELDITELQSRLEGKQAEVQSRLRVDFERLVGPLREKLARVVDEIGREDGYSLILMKNTPGVMFSDESLDVTELVIKKFNEAK